MSELLRGVDLTRVDRKHLTKICKAANLQCDTSIDSMVATLADMLVKKHKADPKQLLRCDFCGGSSDSTFDVCPYCGLNDEEGTKKAEELKAKEPKPEKPAKAAKAPKEDKAPGVAKTKGKGPKSDLAVVHTAELVSTRDLDDSVAEIKKIQLDIVDNHWLLGKKLQESHEKNLYKLRLDSNNKPKYRSWGQWVEAELEISPRYAFDLAATSMVFTQEQIKEFGVTKLRVLARIPEEAKRQNLLEKARGELNGKPMTRTEVERAAKQGGTLPARKGLGGGSHGDEASTTERVSKRAQKAAEKAAEREKNEGVTVVVQPGRISIPLFNGNPPKKGGPVRAFSLDDEPQAIEDTLNGIKTTYKLVRETEGLVLVVERVRES